MKKFICSLLAMLIFAAPALAADQKDQLNVTGKKGKIVVKSAVYGFGGGLVVGLASQVFKKKTKNIFMFGSLGLYAGILLGIYVISSSTAPQPYEGPDTYEDFSMLAPEKTSSFLAQAPKEELKLNFINLSF